MTGGKYGSRLASGYLTVKQLRLGSLNNRKINVVPPLLACVCIPPAGVLGEIPKTISKTGRLLILGSIQKRAKKIKHINNIIDAMSVIKQISALKRVLGYIYNLSKLNSLRLIVFFHSIHLFTEFTTVSQYLSDGIVIGSNVG